LIVVIIISLLSPSTFSQDPKQAEVSAAVQQDAISSQYVTTFPLAKTCTSLGPWVLSPSTNNRTVWLEAYSLGQQNLAQIINFTLSPQTGQPQCHVVASLTNAIPTSVVFDRYSNRVWFTFNNTLAFIDPAGSNRTAWTYPGGDPQYIAIDSHDNLWITLVATNQIVEYVPTSNKTITTSTLPASVILQGIASAPDGTVWFAETGARKLGHIIPCSSPSCPPEEFSPPPGIVISAPTQVVVDLNGIVWFTDHGSNLFGSFSPVTQTWRVYPVGYCSGYCADVLPNAISLFKGRIWFSEHIAGRISSYDPGTEVLTEYVIPSNGDTPLSWWAWPGLNNLVWFTSYALGQIGYVNASMPVNMNVNATTPAISVRQGASETIQVKINSQEASPISLGISPSTTDRPFFSASSGPSQVMPSQGLSTSTVTISASWNSTLGNRYLALTAFNGKVAVSTYVAVIVVDAPLPYVTLGIALIISLGSLTIYFRRPGQKKLRSGRQTRK